MAREGASLCDIFSVEYFFGVMGGIGERTAMELHGTACGVSHLRIDA